MGEVVLLAFIVFNNKNFAFLFTGKTLVAIER